MKIEYSRAAVKSINNLDKQTKKRVKASIEKIPDGDIKPLRGSKGSYRLRVGSCRIIFSYLDDSAILVDKVGPRGGIYKGV